MSKKNKNYVEETEQVIVEKEMEVAPVQELTAVAYAESQETVNQDVTITKPIGYGGPVPIAIPKYNTIQLQPIVVPLAVVPYMSQDAAVLRTDAQPQRQQAAPQKQYAVEEEYADVEIKEEEKEAKKAKKKCARKRGPAFFVFLFSLLVIGLFVAAFVCNIKGITYKPLAELNVIGRLVAFFSALVAKQGFATAFSLVGGKAAFLCLSGTLVLSVLTALISLIGVFSGKMPKAFVCVLSFLDFATALVLIVFYVVKKQFTLASLQSKYLLLIVLAAVLLLLFIASLTYSGKKPVKKEAVAVEEEI